MRPWKLTEEREQARLRIQAQVVRERQQPTKRIVLAFDGKQTKIDPQFCDHQQAFTVTEHGETWLECPSCGATIDDQGDIVRVAPDEIPY
jgi:hypothetical protein